MTAPALASAGAATLSCDLPEFIARAAAQGWPWAEIAWRRAAAVEGAWYDQAKADAIVELWPKIFRLTDLHFAGVPFRLALWQEVTVRLLVGWKIGAEIVDPHSGRAAIEQVRLFRRLLLWIPRKNGKSEFLAALALLFWALDAVHGGQGYCFALNEKQARTVLNKIKAMIFREPRLAKDLTVFGRSIWMARRQARFEILTGKAEGKHGLSPYVSVGDEMHEWQSRDLDTTIRQGMGAQLQPIELFASTAGLKSAVTGYELFQESLKILAGPISPPAHGDDTGDGLYDPTSLVVMFCLEDDDDWQDESNWRRVNPNLGLSPTIDFLRREAALAKNNSRAESHFRRYHLNQWVENAVKWLPPKKWDACCEDKDAWRRRADELRGRKCFLGFDVSSTQDITALVAWFPPDEDFDTVRLFARFWCPEENIDVRSKRDRVAYDRWVKMGALEATPGDYVDQSYVQAAIGEALEAFDVQVIGFDPWNATKLVTDLQNDGVEPERFVKVRQGIPSLGESTKAFEKLVFAGKLDHGGHPVLKWMAGNAWVRFDRNMNFAPDKERSREKIDGIVAAVIAHAVAINADPQGQSFWDS
ncbi:MAG: terminase large subunit [Methylocystis sp.]|uniref:terminase large subunit n=1 Tax=Methylocystis sp. TaxID=1911079 RepID=UPI003DA28F77